MVFKWNNLVILRLTIYRVLDFQFLGWKGIVYLPTVKYPMLRGTHC